MLNVLRSHTYRSLFFAQVVALLGTGIATVALGLIAYDLAGENAALVLGYAFTIKMVAYVLVAPIAGAFADRIPRRAFLITLDLVRCAVALALPFVTEIWQIYALIFLLQVSSAAFTPTFQATIPDVLPDEKDYTNALSLSRLAYDLEAIFSPLLAGALLLLIPFSNLFLGTALGFFASALLVFTVVLPKATPSPARGVYDRTTRGIRYYLATPRLRGLLALCFSVAAAGAMVLVNTVVLVRAELGLDDAAVALTMAAFGAGSMTAAFALPGLLEHRPDRRIMFLGAWGLVAGLLLLWATMLLAHLNWASVLIAWFVVGVGFSTVLTPSGRLLKRSSHQEDRPAIFAAQFALSHLCWLITYPLAGVLMTTLGSAPTTLVLLGLTLGGIAMALRVWPADDPEEVTHRHDNLPLDHPHLQGHRTHSHPLIIDDNHTFWGTQF